MVIRIKLVDNILMHNFFFLFVLIFFNIFVCFPFYFCKHKHNLLKLNFYCSIKLDFFFSLQKKTCRCKKSAVCCEKKCKLRATHTWWFFFLPPLETFTRQTDRQTRDIREKEDYVVGHKIINLKTIFCIWERRRWVGLHSRRN